ncbi:unnamed protein product [Somion occarium]|uniref:ATPase inhibitor, mitochondrial n=1 Tax=Somion occarium TaxID=3059160 RepID=A0ABP1DAZ3_9APHY
MSGTTAQDGAWKSRESSAENQYARQKEAEQLAALREQMKIKETAKKAEEGKEADKDFEGGFGGQEDLEDRYATTSGEH